MTENYFDSQSSLLVLGGDREKFYKCAENKHAELEPKGVVCDIPVLVAWWVVVARVS